MKILITGGTGMVGKNLIEYLSSKTKYILLYPNRQELNLLNFDQVNLFISKQKPDLIIHSAGLVGGIQANIKSPYSFIYQNLLMGLNLVQAAISNNVQNFINLGSSCMYPRKIKRELKESDILKGELEPTNEGYAISKIAIAKLCEFAKNEFNLSYKTIIPCNLYGKWDSFEQKKSHLIPAVIHKLHEAKKNNEVATIWGDGSARREFMFVEDLADFILFCINNYEKLDSYTNVGLGHDYSILDYYKIISSVVKYNGDFKFDKTKPAGMMKKLCSVEKQNKLGWKPKHTLKMGLIKTYKFYLQNYEI